MARVLVEGAIEAPRGEHAGVEPDDIEAVVLLAEEAAVLDVPGFTGYTR